MWHLAFQRNINGKITEMCAYESYRYIHYEQVIASLVMMTKGREHSYTLVKFWLCTTFLDHIAVE